MLWKDTRTNEKKFSELNVGDVFETDWYACGDDDDSVEILCIKISQYTAFDICNNNCIDYTNHLTDAVSPRQATLMLE